MKRILLLATMAGAMLIAPALSIAQTAPQPSPAPCPNCPSDGVPKKDGTGPGAKNNKGKRTGPQDGSGPLHTPPNTGKGRRGGGGGGRR